MGKKKRRESGDLAAVEHSHSPAIAPTPEVNPKKKAKLEKRKLAPENQPAFNFVLLGFKKGRPITIKDLREFTLHLLSAPGHSPSPWLQISNKNNIEKVVTLFVPGITPATLGLPSTMPAGTSEPQSLAAGALLSRLPVFTQLFSHYAPTRAPGDRHHLHSVMQTFVTVPLSEKDKLKLETERQQKFEAATSPTIFILQPEAMADSLYTIPQYSTWQPIETSIGKRRAEKSEWYPDVPSSDLPPGWMQTPQYAMDDKIKCLALDCEMVRTSEGQELARITVVDRKLEVVYDTYVQPSAPVEDYATQWSGITAKDLDGVTTTLADVQQKLMSLVDYKTILVGHSLENDLRAVKLAHPWVVDTALIYQHTRGPPFKPSLKWLAQKWLNKAIQIPNTLSEGGQEVVVGHDSKEDAQTAMELLNLKMIKGPMFGEFVTDQEVIFERAAKGPQPKTSAVVDHGAPGQWHGSRATSAVSCTNDGEILEGIKSQLPGHDYVFARLLDLSHALGWSSPSASALGKMSFQQIEVTPAAGDADTSSKTESEQADRMKESYAKLNEQIKAIYQSLPPRTALVLFTGHSDPRRMGELLTKKNKFDRLWKSVKPEDIAAEDKFMADEERELQEQAEKAKAGMAFFACKNSS